jgi:hypothetical protein
MQAPGFHIQPLQTPSLASEIPNPSFTPIPSGSSMLRGARPDPNPGILKASSCHAIDPRGIRFQRARIADFDLLG